jgi:acetyl-CoA acyltransferase
MVEAFLCAGVRTPIGRYGGALSAVRPDDLLAHAIRSLLLKLPTLPPDRIEEVFAGCANQAGEDNRNVARMAALVAGLPDTVPAATINRLCGSGLDAIGVAARAIRAGEIEIAIAGGVESMSRAPFVLSKASVPFSRHADIFDTTIGWRFANSHIKAQYGLDSMPETAENVAADFQISRQDQDLFAWRSQVRAANAQASGRLAREIVAVEIPDRKGVIQIVDRDEHPRQTTLEQLAALPTPFRKHGSVSAGNSSGLNDGAAAVLIASGRAVERYQLLPPARICAVATAGVAPRIMGIGPVPATRKLMDRLNLGISQFDVIELNEAFAAQALACLRGLGIADDAEHVNPNGGAIALGHPLGMSGARLALTLAQEISDRGVRFGLATMCIGVGQGIAMALEGVR